MRIDRTSGKPVACSDLVPRLNEEICAARDAIFPLFPFFMLDINTITLNTITASGVNLPTNAIYSAGSSTTIVNSGIAITNKAYP
jgi:hypothetical protein